MTRKARARQRRAFPPITHMKRAADQRHAPPRARREGIRTMYELTPETAETLKELLGDECPLLIEQRAGEGWTDSDWLAVYRDQGFDI
jgi:hypothetical protein